MQGLALEQAPPHLLCLEQGRNLQGGHMHPNLRDAPFTLPIQGAFTGDQMTFTAGDPQPQAQDSWWGPQKTVQPTLQLVSEKTCFSRVSLLLP